MAVQQFQIFVYFNSKPRILDVLPDHKSEDVLSLLRDKLSQEKPPILLPQEDVFLRHRGGRPWDVEKTLVENRVRSESSHEVYRPPNPIDPEVTEEMLLDLNKLSEDLHDKSFLFIGIGSYVNSRPEERVEKSIKRQQCRDSLIAWCKKEQWSLTVVLIDPGFRNAEVPPNAPPQIYDLDQAWRLAERKQEGKIRVYGRTDAPEWRLISYGTGIREYSLIKSLTDTQNIAGLPIMPMLANKVQKNGLAQCCVVSGNFYAEPTPSGQYCTIGNPEFLRAAGFTPSSTGFNPQPD